MARAANRVPKKMTNHFLDKRRLVKNLHKNNSIMSATRRCGSVYLGVDVPGVREVFLMCIRDG